MRSKSDQDVCMPVAHLLTHEQAQAADLDSTLAGMAGADRDDHHGRHLPGPVSAVCLPQLTPFLE